VRIVVHKAGVRSCVRQSFSLQPSSRAAGPAIAAGEDGVPLHAGHRGSGMSRCDEQPGRGTRPACAGQRQGHLRNRLPMPAVRRGGAHHEPPALAHVPPAGGTPGAARICHESSRIQLFCITHPGGVTAASLRTGGWLPAVTPRIFPDPSLQGCMAAGEESIVRQTWRFPSSRPSAFRARHACSRRPPLSGSPTRMDRCPGEALT
jgi:hypothetical protein